MSSSASRARMANRCSVARAAPGVALGATAPLIGRRRPGTKFMTARTRYMPMLTVSILSGSTYIVMVGYILAIAPPRLIASTGEHGPADAGQPRPPGERRLASKGLTM